jgi:molybdopterin-guanine dinucleotide biosynthesis protein A
MRTGRFDAIVLTGGRGERLGGVDKAAVRVAGATLLERARAAVRDAATTTVVGAEVPGGPVAGLSAGLRRASADVVVVLACDMPLVSADTVGRLVAALGADHDPADPADPADPVDAALLTDGDGRRQYLAAAYRTRALREALGSLGAPEGQSMRRLVRGLRVREVPAHSDEAMDCDTWPDVQRAARRLEDG